MQAMADQWAVVTPQALRQYDGRAATTDAVIGARRASPRKSPPSKRQSEASPTKWGAVNRVLRLVPWGALVACSCMMTGLIIYLVHGKKAASKGSDLLALVESNGNGWAHRVKLFGGSYPVTAGLVGGCIIASVMISLLRLQQKLATVHKRKETWGKLKFGIYSTTGAFAVVVMSVSFLWFVLNGGYLAAWCGGLWTLQDSATAASINMQHFGSELAESTKFVRPVKAADQVCPSPGCLGMNYFPWLESNRCLCSQQLLSSLLDTATATYDSVLWALGAMACLIIGTALAIVQGVADLAIMRTEWTAAQNRSKVPMPSSLKRRFGSQDDASYAVTPGTALRKPGINARGDGAIYAFPSPYPGWGSGYMD